MYLPNLALLSVQNLFSRLGRTVFLSLGVLIATAILTLTVRLVDGISEMMAEDVERSVGQVETDVVMIDEEVSGVEDSLARMESGVEHVEVAFERVQSEQEDLLASHSRLDEQYRSFLQETPVHRIEVLPREGAGNEIKESDVARIETEHGEAIERIVKVAFLFPMFVEVRLIDFEVEIGGEAFDLAKMNRGQRMPVSVYGVDAEEMKDKILGPDEKPSPDADLFRFDEGRAIPVVLPAEWMAFVKNIDNEDMRARLTQVLAAGLFTMMQNERTRDRLVQRFGQNFLTESFVEDAVEDAIEQIYTRLRPENLQRHLRIVLYPGLTREDRPIPTELVGVSHQTPFTGITVPSPYIARWHREHFRANTSVFSRLFSGEPEVNYSKLVIYGKDLDATIELVDALRDRYLLRSRIDEARRLRDRSRQIETDRRRLDVQRKILDERRSDLALQRNNLEARRSDLGERRRLFSARRDGLLAEAGRIRELVAVTRQGAWAIALFIFLLAGVGILNGLTLSVLEQAKRIGILRAIGARRSDILLIFLFEAFLIGLVGSGLGVAIGEGSIQIAQSHLAPLLPDLHHPTAHYFEAGWSLRGAVLGVGIVVSLLAGLFPAAKAAFLRPVEVLKG